MYDQAEQRNIPAVLDVSDASDDLDFCFKKLLKTIANIDIAKHVGLTDHPCSFVVYAHENKYVGEAYSQYVKTIIDWLKIIRAPNLSDKSPLLLWSENDNDTNPAVDDILSNQMRLLPAYEGFDKVEKVILCVSPVLKRYCEHPFAIDYITRIQNLYQTQKQNMQKFEEEIRRFVETQLKANGFHHILTEIAFLNIRRLDSNEGSDQIIPITLDGGDLGKVISTGLSVYLKLSSPKLGDLHSLFFKLLQRLYPFRFTPFELCHKCYKTLRHWCEKGGDGTPLQEKAAKEILRLLDEVINLSESGVRDGEWRDYMTQIRAARTQIMKEEQLLIEYRAIMKTLNAPNMTIEIQKLENRKDELFKDSYKWILAHEDYQDFIDWGHDNIKRLLWIKGDPGKGKTMLLLGIVRELKLSIGSSSDDGYLSYFFCQGTNERLNTATSVLRGLVSMLLIQDQSLLRHLDRLKIDRLDEDDTAFYILKSILLDMLEDESLTRAYLVIDALDECMNTQKPGLFELLKLISDISANNSQVKWLVSSRNIPAIERSLGKNEKETSLALELNDHSVADAVKAYIDHKMLIFRKSLQERYVHREEASVSAQLQTVLDTATMEIRQKAGGTFLWVALVFQQIQGCSGEELLKYVQQVPSDLDNIYAQMLRNVNKLKNSELHKKVLQVAVNAYRPLHLRELGELTGLNELAFQEDIVRECGLLTLSVDEKIVHFVHQSAKDYLIKSPVTGSPGSEIFSHGLVAGHFTILSRSLDIMSQTLQKDIYKLKQPGCLAIRTKTPDPDPLTSIRYSCVYWVDHLEKIKDSNDTLLCGEYLSDGGRVHEFLKEHLLHWFEALSLIGEVSKGINGLYSLERMILERLTKSSPSSTTFGYKSFKRMIMSLSSETTLSHKSFVHDAIRVFRQCAAAVEEAPLQVYCSALIFSPEESVVRQTFKQEMPQWISPLPRISSNWSPCVQTLKGHGDLVRSVAFSPNGQQLASGSNDNTIRLWDASTGKCLQTLEGHRDLVRSVAFSPNGQQLASGSNDDTIRLWDASTGKCLQTLKGHGDKVTSVVFSPNGQQLTSGSIDSTVRLWDASTGKCLQALKGHRDQVYSVAFSPDGQQLASGSKDCTIRLWDASIGKYQQTLKGHRDRVCSVIFSPDGQQLASGSEDYTIRLWDASTGKCLQTLKGHKRQVNSVAFSPDGQQLASGSNDYTIRLWDASTGKCLQKLEGYNAWVNSVAFSSDGQQLASGSNDDTVQLWDVSIGKYQQTLKGYRDPVCSIIFSPDGQQLASGSKDYIIRLWDVSTGKCLQTLEGHKDCVKSVAFSPDGQQLASGSIDYTIRLWNARTGKYLQTLKGHNAWVSSVAFSPDGQQLASGSDDDTVRLWDVSTGTCLQTLIAYSCYVFSVVFSSDGQQLASGADNTIRLWDPSTGKCLQTLEGHKDWVNSVAFSPDGQQLASGSDDDTVRLWDASTGKCLQTLKDAKRVISFSRDGSNLLTDSGTLSLRPTLQSDHAHWIGCGIGSENSWVTWDGRKVLWLPPEYQPVQFAIREDRIGVGCQSGAVFILSFARKCFIR
ncbi:hypothetical protein GJ744_004011 [Endocarpon pusillum]|uniref:NACHT domain-containing protein n=1 Tax=Endocarpon pusillum TaxID=364733 RepID=A0A8H7DXT4_9EURO|nr:hypothetical protein GJ744_004011 [Endocarpon pusillum]